MCYSGNNFGIGGMMPGLGIGNLPPGSSVKITQTTTGGAPSVFGGHRYYQGGGFVGGFNNSTSINIQNGPDGFWGFASGLMNGISGRCRTGWNNMCTGWNNMYNNWSNGNFNMGMPNFAQGANFGIGAAGLTGAAPTNPLLTNLNTLGESKWKIVDNYDGTFTAKLDSQYADSGENETVTGDYSTVMEKINTTKIKAAQSKATET